ncbi:MAG: hypothetical protein D6797_04265 [Bdellovibrio sp.]|nr:MAG: hypothetical protein D6797_04265 [Bdellovibrio sp.]
MLKSFILFVSVLGWGFGLEAKTGTPLKKKAQKSLVLKKVSQKQKLFLPLKWSARMEYRMLVKYIKLLRRQVRELSQFQEIFYYADPQYLKNLKKKNAAFSLFLPGRLWAAGENPFVRGKRGQLCVVAGGLSYYTGGVGTCKAKRCQTTSGSRGYQCDFWGTGLSGADSCVSYRNFENATQVCMDRARALKKRHQREIKQALEKYRSFIESKKDAQNRVRLKAVFKEPLEERKRCPNASPAQAGQFCGVKDMTALLLKYAYDDEVYAHLVQLTDMYRIAKKNFPKDLARKIQVSLEEDLGPIEGTYNAAVEGIKGLWDKFEELCEKPLNNQELQKIRNGYYQIPSVHFQRLEQFRKKVLQCLDQGQYPQAVFQNESSSQPVSDPWSDIYRRDVQCTSHPEEGENFFRDPRVETILSYPECKVLRERKERVKQKLSSLTYSVPDGDRDEPPPPEIEEGEILLESKSLGCPGFTIDNSGIYNHFTSCVACAAERRKINYDQNHGPASSSGSYVANPNYMISPRWLSFLDAVAMSCKPQGGNNFVTPEEMQKFVETYGHCSVETYDWGGIDFSDKVDSVFGLMIEDISASSYESRRRKNKRAKAISQGLYDLYGVPSQKALRKAFCSSGSVTQKRKKVERAIASWPRSSLKSCIQEGLAQARVLYPAYDSHLQCAVSFTKNKKSLSRLSTQKVGQIIYNPKGLCYVSKQINRWRDASGVIHQEVIYSAPGSYLTAIVDRKSRLNPQTESFIKYCPLDGGKIVGSLDSCKKDPDKSAGLRFMDFGGKDCRVWEDQQPQRGWQEVDRAHRGTK